MGKYTKINAKKATKNQIDLQEQNEIDQESFKEYERTEKEYQS